MSQGAPSNIVQLARLRRLSQEHPQAAPKPKILFVDDEERILNSLRALFRMEYEVTVTTDGYHALELLKRHHYHLLVSDQRMPIMQGVELLRQAKEYSPHTVRILLTGFSDLAAIVGSVNEGEVYRYICKPWDSEELRELIAGAVKIGLELAKLTPLPKPDLEEPNQTASQVKPAGVSPNPVTQAQTQTQVQPQPQIQTQAKPEKIPHEPLTWPDNLSLLFVDRDLQLLATFQELGNPRSQVLAARTPEDALALMEQHEVGVIVASIDGIDRDNFGFLCLLKKEHPHVVSLAVARLGDSETIIDLVNSARVFRVIFHPLRPKVLQHHLEAAIKQVGAFREQPALLQVQAAKEIAPSHSMLANLSSRIKTRLSSIKSFFRR